MNTTNNPPTDSNSIPITNLELPLEQGIFFRSLIRELAGLLEEIIGLEDASGYISVVGQRIGDDIDNQYKNALEVNKLNKTQIGSALVDLKTRIKGDFYILEANSDKVVLGNRECPFGDKVLDRPSLCMMTSNVFGTIAANNTGYSKVVLDKTIAKGDPACHVTVYFKETDESLELEGREYYSAE